MPPVGTAACILACALTLRTNLAHSENFVPTRVDPDPPGRRAQLAPPELPPSSDLDGLYVWLGPVGAASRVAGEWDSTIGGDLSVVYVREGAALGAIGGSFGASRWTERGGGRLWVDAIAGTHIGRMVGLSAGPILELSELSHPRIGGTVGVWAFVGVTPFVRIGTVQELGSFIEMGLHIALPAMRRR